MKKIKAILFRDLPEKTVLILLGFILGGLLINIAVAAWQEPTADPPDGNVAKPVNISSNFQTKAGGLGLQGTLDMHGNKIANVSEIDPVMKINDKKYTTYMPDAIGQKIYAVGEDQLDGDKKEINLAGQPEGSDLWLFWQSVEHASVKPFVSPQGPASIYARIEGSKLVVEKFEGKDNVSFSLRLIGTRLDHADNDSNLYEDQEVENYLDIDKLRD